MPTVPDWISSMITAIGARHGQPDAAPIVIKNIEDDGAIDDSTWRAFTDALEAATQTRSAQPEEAFNQACANSALSGPPAELPDQVGVLNRVVTRDVFVTKALARGRYNSADPAGVLRRYFNRPPEEQLREVKDFELAQPGRAVWAFFPLPEDGAESDRDPIDSSRVRDRADFLRDALGLQHHVPPNKDLVCLRYPTDNTSQQRIPLAISAGFNPCFRPSSSCARGYGYTYDSEGNPGFPEIVHKNLTAGCIIDSPRLVRWTRKD